MYKYLVLIALVASTMLDSMVTQAAVVDIVCRYENGAPLPEDLWSFDYDSQVLTVNEISHEFGYFGRGEDWLPEGPDTQVRAWMDSESTITIVKNITNSTDVPWTAYTQAVWGAYPVSNRPFIVENSVKSTILPSISYENSWTMRFSGSDPILPGESFTIQFDIQSDYCDECKFMGIDLTQYAIPEPATMVMLGLGGMAILRRRAAI